MDHPTSRPQRTLFGHPIGLYVLFFTEMWERFSYYGMRALLILYMVNYFKWQQKDASTIYKVYTSFVYVTPILGGYLADRYLGNRWAVIIGAVLMAIGHFLMAFEEYPIFMSALIFLILGNGFFKPNMSTQVGRLYPANDGRRDGAYTIFYMGINLGALLSPLVCGWLADNTVGGFHSGFTMAGIGMVLGLLIYLFGQPLIQEIPTAPSALPDALDKEKKHQALTEAEAAAVPSVLGQLSGLVPSMMAVLGVLLLAAAMALFLLQHLDLWNAIMLAIGGACSLLMAYVSSQVQGGLRDRILAILILGLFVMFFWAAFEQAGNVLNLWADQSTNRFLTREAAPPSAIPVVLEKDQPHSEAEAAAAADSGFLGRFVHLFVNMVTLKPKPDGAKDKSWQETMGDSFNPVPTAWFQAINAVAIFLLAPLFAWMWVMLDRRQSQPSIPMKMALGLVLMSASMAIMLGAANQEQRQTLLAWSGGDLPPGIEVLSEGRLGRKGGGGHIEPFHAGRLTFDSQNKRLNLAGVLTENERDLLIEMTAPASYKKLIDELQQSSKNLTESNQRAAAIIVAEVPPGLDMKFAGLKKSVVQFFPAEPGKAARLVAYKELAEKEVKALLIAGGDASWRSTIHELWAQSTTFRVSSWWLFWSYILATLGELCLSPVGLSMVSKLAPAKFATMLMGMWMLTSAFGNFAAGALGEIWGTVPPISFFVLSTAVVGGAALVLWLMVKFVTRTMHGVN